jgi:nucleoside-triphosphatase THEP1
VIILLAWFLVISPLLKLLLTRWLEKRKRKSSEDIKRLIHLLPQVRAIVASSWGQSREGTWYGGTHTFVRMVLAGILGMKGDGKVYILTGDIRSGKTTGLSAWIKTVSTAGGILSPIINGKRVFMDVSTGSTFQMESGDHDVDPLEIGRYKFSRAAFNNAAEVIDKAIAHNDWVIIDEVGPLELKQEGFYPTVVNALEHSKSAILVVRSSLVEDVKSFFGIENAIVIRAEDLSKLK